MILHVECGAHIGWRSAQEDSVLIDGYGVAENRAEVFMETDSSDTDERTVLYALSDGMGGYSYGRDASEIVLKELMNHQNNNPDVEMDVRTFENILRMATEKMSEDYRMGATVAAVYIRGNTVKAFNVGDSKILRVKNNSMEIASEIMNVAAEKSEAGEFVLNDYLKDPERSALTSAIGRGMRIKIHEERFEMEPGEKIVIASDGIDVLLPDQILENMIRDQVPIKTIVNEAIKNGADDNISIISISA